MTKTETDRINTKEYWNFRFNSGNWNRNGNIQTKEYAKANIEMIGLSAFFNGTILDFGCALGDAIPVYSNAFPKAKILGTDISEAAIAKCKKKYGRKADFFLCDDYTNIPFVDVIVASHVMEHLTNDKLIITELIKKCRDLFVFVPYKEEPLYFEHVNYYDESYYNDLKVFENKKFRVCFKRKCAVTSLVKNLLKFRLQLYDNFSKYMIMFHFRRI